MHKIPKHKISENFLGEIAFMKYISANNEVPVVNYAHRDDYYNFLFMRRGEIRFSIDFEEYDIKRPIVHCILPGQVHFPIHYSMDTEIWLLFVDRMFVKEKFKDIFEYVSLLKDETELDKNTINDLECCVSMLNRRLSSEKKSIEQDIIHSLLSSYIGIIAEIYQKGYPVSMNKRHSIITCQFKSLVSVNYKTLKKPSQYAALLNISPIYLNEAVKNTTGTTVSECIQNEIITQAKRLLFYTNLSIKEIAMKLGYEDPAYFTRLFKKASSFSPTQFREKYLK